MTAGRIGLGTVQNIFLNGANNKYVVEKHKAATIDPKECRKNSKHRLTQG